MSNEPTEAELADSTRDAAAFLEAVAVEDIDGADAILAATNVDQFALALAHLAMLGITGPPIGVLEFVDLVLEDLRGRP